MATSRHVAYDHGPGRGHRRRRLCHGVHPVYSETSQPARQDVASRPDLSSFKLDFSADDEIAFLFTYHFSQADDDIDMYLVHDANADGPPRRIYLPTLDSAGPS